VLRWAGLPKFVFLYRCEFDAPSCHHSPLLQRLSICLVLLLAAHNNGCKTMRPQTDLPGGQHGIFLCCANARTRHHCLSAASNLMRWSHSADAIGSAVPRQQHKPSDHRRAQPHNFHAADGALSTADSPRCWTTKRAHLDVGRRCRTACPTSSLTYVTTAGPLHGRRQRAWWQPNGPATRRGLSLSARQRLPWGTLHPQSLG
jgi:hypothetical protein